MEGKRDERRMGGWRGAGRVTAVRRGRRRGAWVSWGVALGMGVLVAEAPLEPGWFEAHYTKREHRIPMRDGVRLFTVVYTPKDRSTTYPILLQRTPYNLKPYTVDEAGAPGGVPDSYLREKFIFALQDVRGRFASEGTYVDLRPHLAVKRGPRDVDESTDAYDTIDWLVREVAGNNGRVGLQGISLPGFYAAAGMIDSHPALKAVSPQAPAVEVYDGDDALRGGAFWLVHNFGFFAEFGQVSERPTRQEPVPFDYGTPDGYRFFLEGGSAVALGERHFRGRNPLWTELMEHIGDAAWCRERGLTQHLKNVGAAVLTVGGWFDAEDLEGALRTYRETERNNPGIFNALVMGPWSHGEWHGGEGRVLGPVPFRSKTAEFFRDEIELPFFRRFLKGAAEVELPEAYVFETGRCEWRREAAWPPANAVERTLYLRPGGGLGWEASAGEDAGGGYDEYVSDPARPVPFTARVTTGMPATYMVEDQRFVATRPDVLVYQTEPLEEEVTLVGPIRVRLEASTSGTDCDWVVKLIDVYTGEHPGGEPNAAGAVMGHYQQLVRGGPLRGKYREGYARPKPLTPGEVTTFEWELPDVCHTFRTGHRIMVQVQSSWFPLMDRNPQTFCDIYRARPEDFRKATQRVYRSAAHRSSLSLRVMPSKP